MRRPEQALQIAVAGYLALALKPPSFWSSIDHGAGKMTPASAGLRKARGVKPGLPDVLVMHPIFGHTLVIGVELKATVGRLSPSQHAVGAAFLGCNSHYFVARSVDEVEGFLRGVGIPLSARVAREG